MTLLDEKKKVMFIKGDNTDIREILKSYKKKKKEKENKG